MLPYRDSRLTIVALVVFFGLVALYALFEGRGQLLGPSVTLDERVAVVHDPLLIVTGVASRISSLALNGEAIATAEDGSFKKPYLLAPGYNRIVLDAKDGYGRTTERVIEVMYYPSSPASAASSGSPGAATSSPASSTAPVAPSS